MNIPTKLSPEKFQEYLGERLSLIRSMLSSKASEYAPNSDDRMHNFNRTLQVSPSYKSREEAIYGMLVKQWVSILDIIEGTKGGIVPTTAMIKEKFGDAINYLILMEASLRQTADLNVYEPIDDYLR